MKAKKRVITEHEKYDRAMRALGVICQIANNQDQAYPERIGAIKRLAAFTLHQNGNSDWWKEFNKQLELIFAEASP